MADRMDKQEWRAHQEQLARDEELRNRAVGARDAQVRGLEKMGLTLVSASAGPGYIRLAIRELTPKMRQQIRSFF